MLTLHRTVIRRVIPGPVPGARPWVLPVFDVGGSTAHPVGDTRNPPTASHEENDHEALNDGRTAREPTTRNERPVCGDAAGRVIAAGAATPCRTDAASHDNTGGSAAE